MSKGRVGRGLASLIPESALDDSSATPAQPAPPKGEVLKVPLSELKENPEQPREVFNPEELEELTKSIRIHGVLTPLIVRKEGGSYILIAGERRMRAAARAGLDEVPVVVREADDPRIQLELALVENLQRADLDPIESAKGFQRLKSEYKYTDQQIATAVGKKRTTITNLMRLLHLPDFVLDVLRLGKITVGHAKAMIALKNDEDKLRAVLKAIDDKKLNVRQVETLVGELDNPEPRTSRSRPRETGMEDVERTLRNALQTTVSITTKTRGGGRITIDYSDQEELERLIELIQQDEL
ncbi:MAG: ParB/RepB/Spo0J family partition protein [Myxococcota bacterium]